LVPSKHPRILPWILQTILLAHRSSVLID
jgi:hypothetical protein